MPWLSTPPALAGQAEPVAAAVGVGLLFAWAGAEAADAAVGAALWISLIVIAAAVWAVGQVVDRNQTADDDRGSPLSR